MNATIDSILKTVLLVGMNGLSVQGQYFNDFLFMLLQHTSMSPDRRLIVVVGDHTDGLIVDSRNGTVRKFPYHADRLNCVGLYSNASRI